MPSRAPDRKDSTPRHGRLLHPSSWAERDDRDHAAGNFFQGGSPKTGHPISPPGPPHRQKLFLTKFPGMVRGPAWRLRYPMRLAMSMTGSAFNGATPIAIASATIPSIRPTERFLLGFLLPASSTAITVLLAHIERTG